MNARTAARNQFNPSHGLRMLTGGKPLFGGGIKRHTVTGWDGTKYKLRGNIDKQRPIAGVNTLTKAVRAMQGMGGKPSDAAGLLRKGVGLK